MFTNAKELWQLITLAEQDAGVSFVSQTELSRYLNIKPG